jgi:hypothetical protein
LNILLAIHLTLIVGMFKEQMDEKRIRIPN